MNQPESEPKLLLAESSDKAFSLRKPADWVINEDLRPDSLRITVVSPDHTSAVDYLWLPNTTGQINALKALAAYQQRLVPGSAKIEWSEVYRTDDHSKATATMQCRSPALALEGKFYMEASATSLSLQGYMVPEGQLTHKRQLLYNIMASLVFSKEPVPRPKNTEPITPQYANIPLVSQVAQDKSVTMSTPKDWGFLAARGRVLTSADNGSQGFTFLTFDGNPILKGATVAQGVIAQPYIPPDQTIKTILAGFGHKNIIIKNNQKDAKASQEFMQLVGRKCDAQDMTVTWTSSKGASCLGFFKIINAAPSPTGLWFSLLAGIWGPQQDFYKYFPMLEQVAASFSVNDQFARRYIQDGLANARALHNKTVAAMQENSKMLEQKQIDWENRQKIKDFSDSKWDDHWRGKSYWVSEMESGKVYEATNYGLQDTRTGTFHEGSGFTYTNFKGQSPVHPSETMTEVPRATMEKLLAQ